jgi:hypothetical protein
MIIKTLYKIVNMVTIKKISMAINKIIDMVTIKIMNMAINKMAKTITKIIKKEINKVNKESLVKEDKLPKTSKLC